MAELEQAAARLDPGLGLPGEPGGDLDPMRKTAMTWVLDYDASRRRLTLPEDVRNLGLAPSAKGIAAIFAAGSWVEIWAAEDWVRVTSARRAGAIASLRQ